LTEFLQQVVAGLASGSIYALLALGIVIIYRSTGIVNFAQGEMATFTTSSRGRSSITGSATGSRSH